jgi:SAM-dependent methyltransferase
MEHDPAQIYETHLAPTIFRPLARVLIDLARPKLGEHILDAACGTGVVARLIAPIVGQSSKVVGLDFDPVMLSMAKSLAPDVEWQEGDLQSLSFADDLFDLVICQQGLHSWPTLMQDYDKFIESCAQVDAWCWPCGRSSQNRLVTLCCLVPWVLYWALINRPQRGR